MTRSTHGVKQTAKSSMEDHGVSSGPIRRILSSLGGDGTAVIAAEDRPPVPPLDLRRHEARRRRRKDLQTTKLTLIHRQQASSASSVISFLENVYVPCLCNLMCNRVTTNDAEEQRWLKCEFIALLRHTRDGPSDGTCFPAGIDNSNRFNRPPPEAGRRSMNASRKVGNTLNLTHLTQIDCAD